LIYADKHKAVQEEEKRKECVRRRLTCIIDNRFNIKIQDPRGTNMTGKERIKRKRTVQNRQDWIGTGWTRQLKREKDRTGQSNRRRRG